MFFGASSLTYFQLSIAVSFTNLFADLYCNIGILLYDHDHHVSCFVLMSSGISTNLLDIFVKDKNWIRDKFKWTDCTQWAVSSRVCVLDRKGMQVDIPVDVDDDDEQDNKIQGDVSWIVVKKRQEKQYR